MSEVRFSPNAQLEQKFGKAEKNTKTKRTTKRAKSNGKYDVKIVDGVKYMTLKNTL